jgi:hypothetical protein
MTTFRHDFFFDAKVVNICLTSKKNGLQKCAHPVLRTFAKEIRAKVKKRFGKWEKCEKKFVTLQLWKKRDKSM